MSEKNTFTNGALARVISRGTISGVVTNLVRFATRLVLVPIIIVHLGIGGYGIWATLMVIAGYLRFGKAGIKTTFQKYVAEALGKGEFGVANELITTGTTIFFALSALVLIPAAIFARFVGLVAGIPAQYVGACTWAIAFLAIAYLISNVMVPYESAVVGTHRVDLMQYFNTAFMVLDLPLYVLVLKLGYGLAGLAMVVGLTEVAYAICGVLTARRVSPQIRLRPKYFSVKVIRELVRFSGSYQLLNLMEISFGSVLPILLLRELGPETAGVFAICIRLGAVATIGLESSLVPFLSGSSMIFGSGASGRAKAFVSKAFKLSLLGSLLPLAFVATYGPTAVMAWTGQADKLFRVGIPLVCAVCFFHSLSKVGMILYRSTGGALMDTLAQLLRMAILLLAIIPARHGGFYGLVSSLVLAELIGMIFMLDTLFRRLDCFSLRWFWGEAAHLSLPVGILILAGEVAIHVPAPFEATARIDSLFRLSIAAVTVCVLAWPIITGTRYLKREERTQIVNAVLPWRREAAQSR